MSKTPELSPRCKEKLKKIRKSLTPTLSKKKKDGTPEDNIRHGRLSIPVPLPVEAQDALRHQNENLISEKKAMMRKFVESFLPGPPARHLRRESTVGYRMQQDGIRISTMMDRRLNLRPVILTEDQIAEYEVAFSKFDFNGDGTISVDELHELLQNIGLKPTGEVPIMGSFTIRSFTILVGLSERFERYFQKVNYTS